MRRVHRKDRIHDDCVRALIKCGCSVLELHRLGGGAPDLLVGRDDQNWLMEIKDGDAYPLQENQLAWHRRWRGSSVLVVRSVAEALSALGITQSPRRRDEIAWGQSERAPSLPARGARASS